MPAKMPEPAKVMDVTHPKNVRPNATSRPVIVASRPMIAADPMIAQSAVDVLTKSGAEKSAGDPTELAERTPELVIDREAKTIVPEGSALPPEALSDVPPDALTGEQAMVTDIAGAPPVDTTTAKTLTSSSIVITEPAETNHAVEVARSSDAVKQPAQTDAVAPQEYRQPETNTFDSEADDIVGDTDDDTAREKTAEQKQAENIEKLIASRLYAVPIGKAAKRRARIVLLIICTLLLTLIALDLLLDMGIFKLSGIPHTTFFSL